MVFVGDYRVPPNVDAVQYFCRDVLPLIHAKVQPVHFLLVGNAPTPDVEALASDRVTVTGYVPETAPFLQRSRVSVAPLRFGAGMKGKVGEAVAHGIPVVTTSVGFQGMEAKHEEDVLVADNPAEFADCVVRLFQDRALCERLRVSALSKMKERFGVDAAKRRLDSIIDTVSRLPSPENKFSSTRRLRHKSMDWLERNCCGDSNRNQKAKGNAESLRFSPISIFHSLATRARLRFVQFLWDPYDSLLSNFDAVSRAALFSFRSRDQVKIQADGAGSRLVAFAAAFLDDRLHRGVFDVCPFAKRWRAVCVIFLLRPCSLAVLCRSFGPRRG